MTGDKPRRMTVYGSDARDRTPAMFWRAVLLGLLACTFACARKASPPPPGPPLRVGMFTENPPIAFRQDDGRLAGIEVDLAGQLAPALNRPLTIVPLARADLRPALLDGRIDVIMSGVPIPTTPDYQVAFGDPYLYTGLATLVRRPDASKYGAPAAVMNTSKPVGVVADSAAARFVAQFPTPHPVPYPLLEDAVQALDERQVDLVVAEAHLLGWYVARNPGLAGVWALLDNNQLAWVFRVNDNALRDASNAALNQWRQQGSLDRILKRWLPYWPGLD